ncbi:zinc finger protein 91-like [Mytilus edulis]
MDEDGTDHCIRLPATNGPRPYKCEVCQRSFREVATLRKHEQLHRADRPYVCTTCGKSFLWSSNLKVHERVHTGERPYKCKICHRCFTQSNDLRRHERNVHMRGKLGNQRAPAARPTGQVNMAAYHAFAMQQRALLQHALTYESMIQTSSVSQHHIFPGQPRPNSQLMSLPQALKSRDGTSAISTSTDRDKDQSSPVKLEQVTPPHSPPEQGQVEHMKAETRYSLAESYSQMSSSSMVHSPSSSIPTSTFTSQNEGIITRNRNGSITPQSSGLVSPVSTNFRCMPERLSMTSLPQPTLPPISSLYNGSSFDRVIDLSVNKSVSSEESEDNESKGGNSIRSKSPPMSETESEEKRHVTTTSETPVSDSGIHHCAHCNIIFNDFTMFHLHQSLHSPEEEDPFVCPSCHRRCQDRIEFMFHMVWHVKYPHTIPNYEPFRENFIS